MRDIFCLAANQKRAWGTSQTSYVDFSMTANIRLNPSEYNGQVALLWKADKLHHSRNVFLWREMTN